MFWRVDKKIVKMPHSTKKRNFRMLWRKCRQKIRQNATLCMYMMLLEFKSWNFFLRFTKGGFRYAPQYVRAVISYLLFSFGTFDSFLAGLVRNQVHGSCYSTLMEQEPVLFSLNDWFVKLISDTAIAIWSVIKLIPLWTLIKG